MQFPITIGLRRSRFLDRVLVAFALAASGVILAFPKPPAILGALLLAVGVLFLWSWWRLTPSLSAIRLERDGSILAANSGSSEFGQSSLPHRASVHPWLTVFRLELPGGHQHSLVLARDSMASDDYRRLRVFLRWRAQFSAVDDSRGEPYS